jgi:hypothetical protein
LCLNLDTGALGGMRVGLVDAGTGSVIAGFSLADCDPISVNSVRATVTWKGRRDLAALGGRDVRLVLAGSRAKVFSAFCE